MKERVNVREFAVFHKCFGRIQPGHEYSRISLRFGPRYNAQTVLPILKLDLVSIINTYYHGLFCICHGNGQSIKYNHYPSVGTSVRLSVRHINDVRSLS